MSVELKSSRKCEIMRIHVCAFILLHIYVSILIHILIYLNSAGRTEGSIRSFEADNAYMYLSVGA